MSGITVGVALVAAKGQSITRRERPALPAYGEFDLAFVAREVFARTEGMRDAAHDSARRQLNANNLLTRERFGNQRLGQRVTPFSERSGSGGKELAGGTWRTDQFLDRNLKCGRDFGEYGKRRVRTA